MLRLPRKSAVSGWRLVALALAFALGACAEVEEQGEKPIQVEVPAAAPRTLGVETPASAENQKMIALFGGEYHDASAEQFVNGILLKLAKAGDNPEQPYQVTILNSPVVNAFAMAPDRIYVTRGLLALANDASEVAAVMAHEIGHITARHAALREEEEKRAALISQAAAVIESRQKGQEVEAVERRTLASFSRQQELEADEIGIRVMAKAGYDPYAAARFLTTLGRDSGLRASLFGQGSDVSKPDLLATHPSTPARVARAQQVAQEYGPPGTGITDRTAYLAAIDGIMYGDDPSDGSIRGTTFIHPRLGFLFVAPDGFVLENSAQAVLGVKAGGREALRLDSVRLETSVTLESYISSGWIDGLLPSTIETLTVNGMPAVTASARAGEWNFRVAVIRFQGDQVYRLIFAIRNLDADAEKRFRASIESFRRTTPEEAQDVKPLRIVIVTAQPGDTVESLSNKMAVADHPLEHFELINGLTSAGPLPTGEHYKIVTD
ncbi:MAG: M48 family metalloprotease [Methylovirgula sp.]|nr:M48 family metalloprotease [Methylovirgula sp.]